MPCRGLLSEGIAPETLGEGYDQSYRLRIHPGLCTFAYDVTREWEVFAPQYLPSAYNSK